MDSVRVLVEVERLGKLREKRWIGLSGSQKRLSFSTTETDRGGYTVHLLCVLKGEQFKRSINVTVPWKNKELRFEWMSFRDKLLPGTEEEWRLKIRGEKGNKATTQLLATMYDASLDQFVQNNWLFGLWSSNRSVRSWNHAAPFGAGRGQSLWRNTNPPVSGHYILPNLNTFGFNAFVGYRYGVMEMTVAGAGRPSRNRKNNGLLQDAAMDMDAAQAEPSALLESGDEDAGPPYADSPIEQKAPASAPIVRTDFRETAFFYPDLLTDRDGNSVLRFKTPDALTRWRILGLAHTKELEIGQFIKEAVTQRPLMVIPNLPRFFRESDRIAITTKISVLEERTEGVVELELYDPISGHSINSAFGHNGIGQTFVTAPGESATAKWSLKIPSGIDAVGVRIIAKAAGGPRNNIDLADGEEHILPILSDRILVTESMPLPVKGSGSHNFAFDKLLTSGSSTTIQHKAVTFEFTPNPAWYAVQALPYMMEFPHECTEQTFSRYYANALASHITEKKPKIKRVFEEWKEMGSEALLSNLEKNAELKSVLLEETPWLMNAQNETDQKKRIGILFDFQRMANEETKALNKLRELQTPEGGWSWFPGMRPSRGITQHILTGLGHLEKLGVSKVARTGPLHTMIQRAVNWLDSEVERDFHEMKRRSEGDEWKNYTPGYFDIHYLYARTFFPQWNYDNANDAEKFYRQRLRAKWLTYGLQEQGMVAMILHRANDKDTPGLILRSLKERATIDDELGMYWTGFQAGYSWSGFPTETHAMLIEAFNEVTEDYETVKELRVFLLKLKQTTDWKTTKATAQACYALLLGGDDWLNPMPMPTVKLGNIELNEDNTALDQEAGTGYIKRSWQQAEIGPRMGNISITTHTDRVAWGALHWQYLEQMDRVTPHDTPFSLKKDIMLKRATEAGDELVAIKDAGDIGVGDKLTIRIELRTDRYLDYVHLKDLRGSGLEPLQRLSGHRYQGGLGYYQSIKDAGMHFFFDRISPGTYVFEYDLRVTHMGDFSNGITTAMCMYAPEFNTHSKGDRVKVAVH